MYVDSFSDQKLLSAQLNVYTALTETDVIQHSWLYFYPFDWLWARNAWVQLQSAVKEKHCTVSCQSFASVGMADAMLLTRQHYTKLASALSTVLFNVFCVNHW